MRLVHNSIGLLPAALVLSLIATLVRADTTDIDVHQVIKEIDELYRSKTSYSEFEMEIVTPHWQRTMVLKAWTLGMDKTFMRITAPKKEMGVGTLRIENEMWNYLPKTDKVIKIPPSMMMSSWMGSDFTNDDLVKEFSLFEDYTYEVTTLDEPEDGLVYINCIPREDLPIVWRNVVIAARRTDYIPVWERYYDEKGRLMRILRFSEITQYGGRKVPAVMEMIPQNKEGHKTVVRYNTLEFDLEIDDEVFSLRNLRSQK